MGAQSVRPDFWFAPIEVRKVSHQSKHPAGPRGPAGPRARAGPRAPRARGDPPQKWKMAKQNRNKCPQKEQKQHLFTNHFIIGFINVKSTTIFNTLKGCS